MTKQKEYVYAYITLNSKNKAVFQLQLLSEDELPKEVKPYEAIAKLNEQYSIYEFYDPNNIKDTYHCMILYKDYIIVINYATTMFAYTKNLEPTNLPDNIVVTYGNFDNYSGWIVQEKS